VHRLLQALVAQGLVTQDMARRRYTLGYRVLALAQAVPGEADLRHICRAHMRWLLEVTEETIALYVGAGDVRICLDELESPRILRMSAGVGRCFPLPRGAAGRALLFDGPAGGDLWRRVTSTLSSTETTHLLSDLREARERGYVLTMGETVDGAASLAAPIYGPDGGVIAALSVGGPASRFTPDAATRYSAVLLEAVARIERDLATAFTPSAPPTAGAAPSTKSCARPDAVFDRTAPVSRMISRSVRDVVSRISGMSPVLATDGDSVCRRMSQKPFTRS